MFVLDNANNRVKLVYKAGTRWLSCKAADLYNGSAQSIEQQAEGSRQKADC
jgi:hypothetical protein